MNLRLVRHAYLPEATLGRLTVGGLTLCTLEEPWIQNPKGPGGARRGDGQESCVPDGEYVLKPHSGTLFKNVYRLSNHALGVWDFPNELPSQHWGRASILIHSGNTTDDILGCILVGLRFWRMNDQPAVLESRTALENIRALLGTAEHQLTIRATLGTQEAA